MFRLFILDVDQKKTGCWLVCRRTNKLLFFENNAKLVGGIGNMQRNGFQGLGSTDACHVTVQ